MDGLNPRGVGVRESRPMRRLEGVPDPIRNLLGVGHGKKSDLDAGITA
jgi:hypothetical protein